MNSNEEIKVKLAEKNQSNQTETDSFVEDCVNSYMWNMFQNEVLPKIQELTNSKTQDGE